MPSSTPEHRDVATERERRRRAAALLGDLLPSSTTDDLPSPDERAGAGAGDRDDELRRDVPPHHGS